MVSGAGLDGVVDKTLGVIEELGTAIVCYEGCCGIMNMRRPIDEGPEADPMTAIAEKYLEVPCAVMSPNSSRFDQLRNTLDEWKVDGVISITVHACTPRPSAISAPMRAFPSSASARTFPRATRGSFAPVSRPF